MNIWKISDKLRELSNIIPEKVAIEYGDEQIKYYELENISNNIANFLIDNFQDEKNVFVMMERGPQLIQSLIGTIKSNGIFIPLDHNLPNNRIIKMFHEVKVGWIITTGNNLKKIDEIAKCTGMKFNVLILETNYSSEILKFENIRINILNTSHKTVKQREDYCSNKHCYIYFTSGSTGEPKAILGRHKSLMHYIQWEINEFKISSKSRVSQLISPSFDAFLRDVFVPLCSGGTLCIPHDEDTIINPLKLIDWLEEKEITLIHTVPSLFKIISNELKNDDKLRNLKLILMSGEQLRGNDIKKFMEYYNNKIQLVNLYGTTETTLVKFFYKIEKEDVNKAIIPVGKPIANTDALILNDDLEICPNGIVGNVYIRTPFITSGYLNDKSLTKKVFLRNPFSNNSNDLLYKTGDLGRKIYDGNLEIIGRNDNQVKIRGIRIVTGEIENILLKYNGIKEVVVMATNEGNNKYLCAYFVATKKILLKEVKSFLLQNIPEYMIPSYFVQLDEMPLNANGKIDRKNLSKVDCYLNEEIEYVEPRNKTEKTLLDIWSRILKTRKISIHSNFFEIGGHSIKAAQLVAELYKEFKVEVSFSDIFNYPTLSKLSEFIAKSEKVKYENIPNVIKKEYYEASSAQKRMYMLQQFDLQSTAYNMPRGMKVEGKLDIKKLESAFTEVVQRHETLRTSFDNIEEKIIQKINKVTNFKIEYIEKENKDIEEIIKNFIKPFNLNSAPLLKVGIIEIGVDEHLLLFDMHHIISDGISMNILINEVIDLYEGRELCKLNIQYKDYTEWQNKLLKSDEMKEQENYWVNRFSDEIPILNIQTDYLRPKVQSYEGDSISFNVDAELTDKLKNIAKETNSTMYMVILSAINILLSRYSGQEDIIVGSPIAGRTHPDLNKVIGMFVNTLAMRNFPAADKTYEEFLKEVRQNALDAYENQDYQFEELVNRLNLERNVNRNVLFDVMFAMQNMDEANIKFENLTIEPYKSKYKKSKFDLSFSANESNEELIVNIEYCTKLFEKETIERMVGHLKNILKFICENREVTLSEINLLSDIEKDKLLYEFNNTYSDYPKNKTIHELFEEQVKKTPNNIAIVFEDKELTYKELNEKANSIAAVLRKKGIKRDSIVGIKVEPSLEMIIGILGILKSGGAYLPIDVEYPEDRIKYMIKDSNVKILLTKNNQMDTTGLVEECIDLEDKEIYLGKIENLQNINNQNDLAYIIYTSGTTGTPKGVMIEHKNLISLILNKRIQFNFNEKDVWTMFHSYCFDFSVWEMYGSLLYGGKLILISKNKSRDSEEFLEILKKEKVTILNQSPSSFYNLINEELRCSTSELTLKYVILGGEALRPEKLLSWVKKYAETKLVNIYGPTEATIYATSKELEKVDVDLKISNIGRARQNSTVYIMDKNLKLQPTGVVGELYIGGDGLCRGYLNNEELNKQKFIYNPYNSKEIIYKTGDLVRMLNTDDIEYVGRVDNQVKIRGFRIEIGEIESQLLKNEDIKDVVVLDKLNEDGIKYLCAYLVVKNDNVLGELRNYLTKKLPQYMIPAYFIKVDRIPLTVNGKVNRKLLPEPDKNTINTGTVYEQPRNYIEKKLVEIWSKVLNVKLIGINHNFFEIGGHSLNATTLCSNIYKELNVKIPLKNIFETPTIKGLSEFIENKEKNIYIKMASVEEKKYYEASSAQKRMYMLQQFDLQSTAYNIPSMMKVEGKLDIEKLESAFTEVVQRHETLRTSFDNIEEKIIQKINKVTNFKIEYIEKENKDIEEIIKNFIKPFNLNSAPLLKVGIIEIGVDEHLLLFDMHHIISDGISMNILINEVIDLYEGRELCKLNIQYKDYTEWQNKLLKSDEMKEQENYWVNRFSDEIPILNIQTDYLRPKVQSYEGDSISFNVDAELTDKLKNIAKETNSTMYMVILSAINILLSRYSGQEDIIVGSPIAGRTHPDLNKVIGMFVNTLAMRNFPAADKTYEEFLKEVRQNALDAYENQDYQFEELVNRLNLERNVNRNVLFDVMFAMQNMDEANIKFENLTIEPYKSKYKKSKFDLSFSANESNEELIVNIEYCTKLFEKETIERMVGHLKNILKFICENREVTLSEINLLSDIEKDKLLYEFNNTYSDYPKNKTIHELFEEQVKKTPNNIAIVFEDKELTYKELNEKANSIAAVLRKKGIKRDSIVGIKVEPSLEMIIGILGILKSGGAYLPIDVEYPEDRIKYMIKDSNVKILLTKNNQMDTTGLVEECIDLEDKEIYLGKIENLQNINNQNDLAYIIYTSGTTGTPKGVMIEHKNLITYVFAFMKEIVLHENDTFLQQATYCFDSFVEEVYPILLIGGKFVIVNKYDALNISKLEEIIYENKITVVSCSPLFLNELNKCRNLKSIHTFISGGDILKQEYISNVSNFAKIYNSYGPTETTVCASYYKINDIKQFNIPIGKPLSNYKIYILDKNKNIVPIGVPGEIYISGSGVARGYLNNMALTCEKFLKDSFEDNTTIYKTGDLAKWLPDGNIEFLGRIDNQVKINGFRIEIGEIENNLINHKMIKDCAVINKKGKDGSNYLCAYVATTNEFNLGELREYLSHNLPNYMIPAHFIQLDELPLMENGKLNRKYLLELNDNTKIKSTYEKPRNNTEKVLVKIWKEILDVQTISINDDFFELGGNSIKMMKLISKVNNYFNVLLDIRELYENRTISDIAAILNKSNAEYKESSYVEVEMDKENMYESFPVTGIQAAYLIGRSKEYEIGGISTRGYWDFDTSINIDLFNEALNKVIIRHPMLRAIILENGTQKFLKEIPIYKIKVDDLSDETPIRQEECIKLERYKISNKVFSTNKWPLFEVKALKLAEGSYRVFINIDIIICDGSSLKILFKDIVHYYNNPNDELDEIKYNFRDYVTLYNNMKKSQLYDESKEYWINKLDKFPTAPSVPLKNKIVNIEDPHFSRKKFILKKTYWEKIKGLARHKNITPSALLCTIYAQVLEFWSNQSYMAINLTVFNRYDFFDKVNEIIGDFTTTMLLDINIDNSRTLWENATDVQNLILNALANRYYEGTEFIREIIKYNKMDINKAIMPIVFTSAIDNDKNSGLQKNNEFLEKYIEDIVTLSQTSQVYLDCQVSEYEDNLSIVWDYVSELFDEQTIDKMFKQFCDILNNLNYNKEYKLELDSYDIKFIEEYNNTKKEFVPVTLHKAFLNQAKLKPNNTAIIHNNNSITYRELDEKSNQVAKFLLDSGVKYNDMVGVLGERNIGAIINILAILKVGAAYVCIDSNYPYERREYILKDSSCIMLLESDLYLSCSKYQCNEINYCDNVESVAYVIYTSGSTGKPKGVIITHKSAYNTIYDINNKIKINENDRIIGLSSLCFDLSVYDVFGSLSSGATLVVVDDQRDVNNLLKVIEKEKVTIWNSVPAIMDMYIENVNNGYINNTLRSILLSGDWIPLKLPDNIKKHFINSRTISLGGATEASIWSIYYDINRVEEEWTSIPYGIPLMNQEIYILNDNLEKCPVGTRGEIYIGGIGIAKGYMNDIEKTKESFVNSDKLGYLYKTGDMGVLHKEGYIEFLGRTDYQIKIRGYRVELGEIEKTLLNYTNIDNATIIEKIDSRGNKYLCAFYVSEKEISSKQLRDYLGDKLPSYMIPSQFVCLKELPLTINGKIDRKSLNEYRIDTVETQRIEKPRNEIEFKILEIWKEVLELEYVSINDDFFDLGGSSLHVQRMKNRLEKVFNIEIPIKSLFASRTIIELSENIFRDDLKDYKNSSLKTNNYEDDIYFWSPIAQWKKKDDQIVINSIIFEGISNKVFPKLYFLTQDGVKLSAINKEFKDIDTKELDDFLKELVDNNILVNKLLSPREVFYSQKSLFNNRYDEKILYDIDAYSKFKNEQFNRSYSIENMEKVYLKNTYTYPESILQRRTFRTFNEVEKITFDSFSAMLSIFRQNLVDGNIMHYYATAGGLSPIDIYVHVKENRIENIKKGLYYYSPIDNTVNLINENNFNLNSAHYYDNKQIGKSSAFSIFFIYNAEVNMPKYGTNGYYYSLIDCGIMVSTLTQAVELLNIGICSIGSIDFSKIRDSFNLNKNQILIHSIEGGIKYKKNIKEINSLNYESFSNKVTLGKQPYKPYYNLSSSQKRVFVVNEMEKESTLYNTPSFLTITGDIDKKLLEEIFHIIIQRHEVLRTSFEIVDGQPMQKIHENVEFNINYMELGEQSIEELIKDFVRPFELKEPPLLRVSLVKISNLEYLLFYDLHHIITDRNSSKNIIRECVKLYNGEELSEIKIQYKDYAEWQNELIENGIIIEQEDYWLNVFKNEIPILNMPTDYPRPIVKNSNGGCVKFKLNKEKTNALRRVGQKHRATMYMILLAVYNVILSKYTNQDDIIVGSPIEGRKYVELENVIGMFVNTLALRNYPSTEKKFIDFLNEVKENALKAYENQDYPFEKLVNKLEIQRDTSRNPIFDVMFIMQENFKPNKVINGLKIEPYVIENIISEFDLTMEAIELENEIEINLEYSTNLFKKSTVEKFIEHFNNVIKCIINNPEIKLKEINMLTKDEENQIINVFNNTRMDIPTDKTVQEIFEEQVKSFPNNVAVVYNEEKLTYLELNENANILARELREKGVKANTIVSIMVERSLDMIIGVLAILKAGGAYLPIDPNYPEKRIKYMIEDSNSNILLTQKDLVCKFNYSGEFVEISNYRNGRFKKDNLKNINSTNDLAYVIYTSGTTANPKGVMVQHYSVINANYTWKDHYKLGEYEVRLLQMASISFDVFVGDFCRSLLNGGTMYICPNEVKLEFNSLYRILKKYKINIFESTPSLIIQFMKYIKDKNLDILNLKLLILGSDICPIEEYRNLIEMYGDSTRIINSYGVTEATIDSSYYEEKLNNIPKLANTPIGKPLHNTKLYILDDMLRHKPIGIYGELYIGGVGVAKGYINREELTAEKFIKNPFNTKERLYKTGDLARWLPDGNVEFLGRLDNQVKIRGHRIELGEIENLLLKHKAITAAVVIDREDKEGFKYLCAYITTTQEVFVNELKDYLLSKLPEYMVPTYFVKLDKILLNSNGKVDRKALPIPNRSNMAVNTNYTLPQNHIEEKILKIWEEVLGVEQIGTNDNFFEIGGDSLKIIQINNKINDTFNINIPIVLLFRYSTISLLAQHIVSL